MNDFGSEHTKKKLDALANYLERYTTALKFKGFNLVYFDAFAGSGEIRPRGKRSELQELPRFDGIEAPEEIIVGSAQRSLRIAHPFNRYVFVDAKKKNVESLKSILKGEPGYDRCEFISGDANAEIVRFCDETDWASHRAVMFLDPFGSQVSWDTLRKIAATKHIDLWYLFPAFLSVGRQITNQGQVLPGSEASLTRITGTEEWRDAFLKEDTQQSLFGPETRTVKQCDPGKVTDWMIQRMNGLFRGGVLDAWMPLGPNQAHWYSLIFAVGNPSEKASALAFRLARAVMKA